jgi:hypothetical protein
MRIRISAVRFLVGLSLAGSLTGCIFNDQKIPAYLEHAVTTTQIVAPNAQAAKPLTVIVRDQDEKPLEGVTVQWSIKSGSGTLSATETKTDDDGVSSINFTAGASTGTTVVLATVPVIGTVQFNFEVKP